MFCGVIEGTMRENIRHGSAIFCQILVSYSGHATY